MYIRVASDWATFRSLDSCSSGWSTDPHAGPASVNLTGSPDSLLAQPGGAVSSQVRPAPSQTLEARATCCIAA